MKLHELPKSKNYKSKAKIVGRGIGSGKGGHTVGRGLNGQSSRSGGNQTPRRDFEGGQNPLSKRLPKLRGFKRGYDLKSVTIRLDKLNKLDNKTVVNPMNLREAGILSKSLPVKTPVKIVLGTEYKGKHTFEGIKVSASVKAAVEKSGGKVA